MLTTSNHWTQKAQEVFAAEKAALLRDLLIKAKRELTYEPIALGGPGSPWLMKWKDGAPILPEEWELLGGTGDSSIERHIKAEKEEVKYADEYLSGIYRFFGELLRSQNIDESAFLVEELYRNELWPVFERLELAISYDNYNLLFEKWNFKLKARTKELEKEELPELIRKGKFCVQASDDIKRIRRMHKGGGMKLAEIKQQYPDMAVWNVVATLNSEDQDTFHHPGTWGPDYDKLVLGKYYEGVSPFTVRDWMKAYRRYEREKDKKPNR